MNKKLLNEAEIQEYAEVLEERQRCQPTEDIEQLLWQIFKDTLSEAQKVCPIEGRVRLGGR